MHIWGWLHLNKNILTTPLYPVLAYGFRVRFRKGWVNTEAAEAEISSHSLEWVKHWILQTTVVPFIGPSLPFKSPHLSNSMLCGFSADFLSNIWSKLTFLCKIGGVPPDPTREMFSSLFSEVHSKQNIIEVCKWFCFFPFHYFSLSSIRRRCRRHPPPSALSPRRQPAEEREEGDPGSDSGTERISQ